MKSMTGFASAQGKDAKTCLDVSVRSVNGRYLDIRLHLPRLYSHLESDLKKQVSRVLERGTVEISIRRSTQTSPEIVFNQKMAASWLQGMQKLAKSLGLQPVAEASALLGLPELYQISEPTEIGNKEGKLLASTLQKALVKLDRARKTEGAALEKGILSHLRDLQTEVTAIEKLRSQLLPELKQRLNQRLEPLLAQAIEPARLNQELAFLLERGDVAEEILRLKSHLQTLQKLIGQGQVAGKKLDFYAQELLREVNTIGSKSQQAELTRRVIEAKAAIERYREQVQNIE